ncbi:hypothetical protein S40285_10891, partial [Stachybotrys chlorohalonatus IBT 40285]
LLLHQIHQHL